MINFLNPMGSLMPGATGNFAAPNLLSPLQGPSPFTPQGVGMGYNHGANVLMQLLMQVLAQGLMNQMLNPTGMMPGMGPGFGAAGAGAGPGLGNFLGGPSGGGGFGGGGGGGGFGGGGGGSTSVAGSGGGSRASSGGGSVSPSGATSGNASPGAKSMMKRAASMIGMHEGRDTAAISKITSKSGINPATTPWCAAFAMNLIDEHKLLDLKGLSNRNYCPTIENWAREKGVYGTPDKYKPKTGDAIMFDWNGDGTEDHIGLVESVKNGKVYTIEGNSSDSVKRNVYDLNDKRIDGYVVTKEAKKGSSKSKGKNSSKPVKPATKPTPKPKPKTPPASTPPQNTKIT